MAERKRTQWPEGIKRAARERLRNGESLSAVARDMGIAKSTLFYWRDFPAYYRVCRECRQVKPLEEFLE